MVTRMSRRVAGKRKRGDTGKYLARIDGAQPVAIAPEHLTRQKEVAARTLGRTAQIGLVLPEPIRLSDGPIQAFANWILQEARSSNPHS